MALTEKAVIGMAVYDGTDYWKIIAWVDNDHEVVVRKVRPHLTLKSFPGSSISMDRYQHKVVSKYVSVKTIGWLYDKCSAAYTFKQIEDIEKGISR